MTLYFKNTYVAWQGAGWYILHAGTHEWDSQWEKAKSLDELSEASAKNRKTAYLTKAICDEIE